MSTTLIEHTPISTSIRIDLSQSFTMQGLYESIQQAYPKDPTLSVIGISIPILNIGCKRLGIIDPIGDIKDAVSRLYNYLMQQFLEPVWKILEALFNILKKFGLGFLDLSIGIFDLVVSDLFKPGLYDRIKAAILKIYDTGREQIQKILDFLGIPKFDLGDIPEWNIESIVAKILAGIWDTLIKKIGQITALIKTGLVLWDLANFYIKNPTAAFPLSPIWDQIYDLILGKIISFFAFPPSIQTLYDAIIEFAKKYYNRIPTKAEIMAIIEKFRLPIFGQPWDWTLPLNPKLNFPEVDFDTLLIQMKLFMNNFIFSLVQKFVAAIERILKVFGLSLEIPTISIPITLCAVKNA
jgi:hypothetical protein